MAGRKTDAFCMLVGISIICEIKSKQVGSGVIREIYSPREGVCGALAVKECLPSIEG